MTGLQFGHLRRITDDVTYALDGVGNPDDDLELASALGELQILAGAVDWPDTSAAAMLRIALTGAGPQGGRDANEFVRLAVRHGWDADTCTRLATAATVIQRAAEGYHLPDVDDSDDEEDDVDDVPITVQAWVLRWLRQQDGPRSVANIAAAAAAAGITSRRATISEAVASLVGEDLVDQQSYGVYEAIRLAEQPRWYTGPAISYTPLPEQLRAGGSVRGVHVDGSMVEIPLASTLIAAGRKADKTQLLRSMIADAGQLDHTVVWVASLHDGAVQDAMWRTPAGDPIVVDRVASTKGAIRLMADDLAMLIADRKQRCAGEMIVAGSDVLAATEHHPRIVLFVDDADDLAGDPEILRMLTDAARAGESVAVHAILACQHPHRMYPGGRWNVIIGSGLGDGDLAMLLRGMPGGIRADVPEPDVAGRFVHVSAAGDVTPFTGLYLQIPDVSSTVADAVAGRPATELSADDNSHRLKTPPRPPVIATW